jgi:hypothetical protein
MRLFAQRRIISGIALVAFLFGVAFPALAVARQALDPTAFATICRVDTGGAAGESGPSGSFQSKLKSAHCLMCVGSATPPSVSTVTPVVVAAVAQLIVVLPDSPSAADDFAALQPLNPRAPPRS